MKIIKAAGGIILSPSPESALLIHRRGMWDLPKGKRDPGETAWQNAVREIKEEVGLTVLCDEVYLCTTAHTYGDIEKHTDWFLIDKWDGEIELQKEEDIEGFFWAKSMHWNFLNAWPSVFEVRDACFQYLNNHRFKPR